MLRKDSAFSIFFLMERPTWLRIVFVLSLISMLGSLYFGYFGDPVANFSTGDFWNLENGLNVCILCWYARILMYPIVFISGVALIRNDQKARMTILPLVVFGIILEAYQYGLAIMPLFNGICDPSNPCTIPYLNYFGFITIPLLCLIAFILIGGMILRAIKQQSKAKKLN